MGQPENARKTFRGGWKGKALALALGMVTALLLAELGLRLFSPLHSRVRGDRIILPRYAQYEVINRSLPGLAPKIQHRKNSLGFRGPEPPQDLRRCLSIVAIGGSTTECFYQSDGHDWPALMQKRLRDRYPAVWVNNAGFDGHSTFGHLVLLRDAVVPLGPRVALFLIGANDVGRIDLNRFDRGMIRGCGNPFTRAGLKRLAGSSELAHTMLTLTRLAAARRLGVSHQPLHLADLPVAQGEVELLNAPDTLEEAGLAAYAERVTELVMVCRESGIEPVLITQPMLFGENVDPSTGVDLRSALLPEGRPGAHVWQVLERYNDVVRATARKFGVGLIDLAQRMPKDSQLFYDRYHFTDAGCAEAARLIAAGAVDLLGRFAAQQGREKGINVR